MTVTTHCQQNLEQQLKDKGVPRSVLKASKKFGAEVAAHILAWAKGDLYNQTRTYPKYTIQEEEHYWKPTPPDYMDGIEPHWKQIRTMVLDSSNQFQPKPPLAFDLTEGSPFQTQLKEVYEIGENLTDEQLEIANKILFDPKFSSFEDAQSDLTKYYSKDSIESVLEKIKKCDLSPGLEFESTYLIQPDLEVIPDSNQNFNVRFKQDNFPLISLDQDLEKQVKNKANKANKQLKEKISEAKWLIRAINKRNETVQNVGMLICRIQADFLSDRSAELKPLSNVELAKKLKISPSTVSRILRSKYIQTPKGAVSMKSLLVSSVSKTRKVTPMQLMEEIQNIVESEKKKLSDQKISDLLNKRGFNLARRTISKYRKKINLPNSRNR